MSTEAPDSHSALSYRELVAWAWSETAPVHRSRANLLIHVIAVSMFAGAHIVLSVGAFTYWRLMLAAPLLILISLLLQKKGHAIEENPAIPFSGFGDFVRRFYAEQFWNFWRFVLTGQWYAAFRAAC